MRIHFCFHPSPSPPNGWLIHLPKFPKQKYTGILYLKIKFDIRITPGVSFINYFIAEVTHGYQLKEDEQVYSEKQRRVTTFMKTPRELEKVSWSIVITY